MPNLRDHIDKARHDEKFLSSFDLDRTLFLDWVVNGIFYSSLHYIDSYFADKGIHPRNHEERNGFIRDDTNLGRPFFTNLYRPLKDDSRDARYDIRTFTGDEVKKNILPLLDSIKKHLNKYISQISKNPPIDSAHTCP